MYENFVKLATDIKRLQDTFKNDNKKLKAIVMHPETYQKLCLKINQDSNFCISTTSYLLSYKGVEIKTSPYMPRDYILPEMEVEEIKINNELYRSQPVLVNVKVRGYGR